MEEQWLVVDLAAFDDTTMKFKLSREHVQFADTEDEAVALARKDCGWTEEALRKDQCPETGHMLYGDEEYSERDNLMYEFNSADSTVKRMVFEIHDISCCEQWLEYKFR